MVVSRLSATVASSARVRRRRGLRGELLGELGVLLAEGVEARLEGGHALLEAGRLEVAGFEGGVVAVEPAFGAARLVGERAALFVERRLGLLQLCGGGVQRFARRAALRLPPPQVSSTRCIHQAKVLSEAAIGTPDSPSHRPNAQERPQK
jgi:hypothetical protein